MDTKVLEMAGLNKKEAKIYLSLLKLKSAPVTKISEESRVDRTQTYDILEKLIDKGLASYVLKNNAKHFSPVDPERILTDLEQKEKEFRALLPTLHDLFARRPEKTSVEIFKGKEGIKSVYKNLLKSKNDYCLLGTPHVFEKILPIFSQQFLSEVERSGCAERIIFNKKAPFTRLRGSEYRYLQSDIFYPTDTLMYNDKVVLFVLSEPYYAIVIESKELARTYRKHFAFLWKQALPT